MRPETIKVPQSWFAVPERSRREAASVAVNQPILFMNRWTGRGHDARRKTIFTEIALSISTQDQAEIRWITYLRSLPQRVAGMATIAVAAEALWGQIRALLPRISAPSARPTDEGHLRVSWNRNGRYLEIVIAPNATYEWSYADPRGNVFDEGIVTTGFASTIPSALLARLDIVSTR